MERCFSSLSIPRKVCSRCRRILLGSAAGSERPSVVISSCVDGEKLFLICASRSVFDLADVPNIVKDWVEGRPREKFRGHDCRDLGTVWWFPNAGRTPLGTAYRRSAHSVGVKEVLIAMPLRRSRSIWHQAHTFPDRQLCVVVGEPCRFATNVVRRVQKAAGVVCHLALPASPWLSLPVQPSVHHHTSADVPT